MGDDGAGVAGQKVFTFANPDNQRRSTSRADHDVRAVRADDGDPVGADDFFERPHDGLRQRWNAVLFLARLGRLDPRVILADQMGEDFGVGFRAKLVSRLSKPFLDPVEVFNHTIVNHGDPAGPVKVRMGVFVRRRAVRGPAGVADAELTGRRLGLEGSAETFVDFPLFFARLEFGVVQHAQPGAVITAVFEPAQSFKQDGCRLLLADVAYDAAHKSSFRVDRTWEPRPTENLARGAFINPSGGARLQRSRENPSGTQLARTRPP